MNIEGISYTRMSGGLLAEYTFFVPESDLLRSRHPTDQVQRVVTSYNTKLKLEGYKPVGQPLVESQTNFLRRGYEVRVSGYVERL